MLRASAQTTGQAIDLGAVTDRAPDPLLSAGPGLRAGASAVIRTVCSLGPARSVLAATAGQYAVVRAAAVAGNFQMMNRLVDATGVPIGASQRAI
ncbi:MAG: alkylhydroperoxidase-related (seleno)protein, partial [Ilumatobacter sp.]